LALTANILSCSIKAFPCTYLGLPITIGKPTKEVPLPPVDKVADYLPGWKASPLNKAASIGEGGAAYCPYISFNSHGPPEMGSKSY
jgi:hypothetical protein